MTHCNSVAAVKIQKKIMPTADRIARFVTTYVKLLNEKGASPLYEQSCIHLISDPASESDEEETPTLRFNAHLLKYFLEGFQVKSKDVQFRFLNFVSVISSACGLHICIYFALMHVLTSH